MDCLVFPATADPATADPALRGRPPPSRLRNSRLLGLLVLLSVSLQGARPGLDGLAQSLQRRAGADDEDVEDPKAQSRVDPPFDYFEATSGACAGRVCTAREMLGAEKQRRDDDDDDEEEDEEEEDVSGVCSSVEGEQLSSEPFSSASNCPSSSDVATPITSGALLKLSSHTVCFQDEKRGFSSSSSSFQELPEGILWGIMAFQALPEIIQLLRINKKINAAVKKFFSVNEQGIFTIPAYTGRPISTRRGNTKGSQMNGNASLRPSAKSIRLFFGQQRRDNHPSSLRHLLYFLAPNMNIPHTEAHTNPANNRGKGCSWVFVTSQQDAERLTAFNKLIFLDVDENNREVYRLAPPRSKMWLEEYARDAGARPTRLNFLPRQPFVIEMPEKSAKRNHVSQKCSTEPILQSTPETGASIVSQSKAMPLESLEASDVTQALTNCESVSTRTDSLNPTNLSPNTFVQSMSLHGQDVCAYSEWGLMNDFPYGCGYYTPLCRMNMFVSAVPEGRGKYRYDPYTYNPLWIESENILYSTYGV